MSNFYDWNQFVKALKIGEFLHIDNEGARAIFVERNAKRAAGLLKANPDFADIFRRVHPASVHRLQRVLARPETPLERS